MAKLLYCWRCKMDMPMLEDHEWDLVAPYLENAIEQIKRYREKHQVSLSEANSKGYGQEALALYNQITGLKETNPTAIWHHCTSLYGPLCIECGKPLRTPSANHCAECGTEKQQS